VNQYIPQKPEITVYITLFIDGAPVSFVTGKAERRDPKDPRYLTLLREMLDKIYKSEAEAS